MNRYYTVAHRRAVFPEVRPECTIEPTHQEGPQKRAIQSSWLTVDVVPFAAVRVILQPYTGGMGGRSLFCRYVILSLIFAFVDPSNEAGTADVIPW